MVDGTNRRELLKYVAGGTGALGLAGGVSAQESKNIRQIVGTKTKKGFEGAKKKANSVHRTLDFGNIGKAVVGDFPVSSQSALQSHNGVKYIENDKQMQALDQTTPWGVDRVDADVAHTDGYTGGSADIAILDTGIDADHPDLKDNLGEGTSYYDCDSDCTEISCDAVWDDDNGHGTHCAGIANAVNNSEGVVGVSTEATLHAVKVLDCGGYGSYSAIAAGVEYATNQGWDVASMSLGGGSSSYALKDACQYAANNGTLVVAAAGNSGSCTDCVMYPAKYDTVVAVSAINSDDSFAWYSSQGPEIDLAAPGTNIYSTIPGGYDYYDGTSMACPHVAGSAALLMSDGYTNTEARERLQETAEDMGLEDNKQGSGLLDVESAIETQESKPNLPTVDTTEAGDATFSGESGDYTISGSGVDVWKYDDDYAAVYEEHIGCDIVAQVTVESQENTWEWAKAGIMVANDITADGSSKGDLILATTPENGYTFQWDTDGNGFIDNATNVDSTTYPTELRLTKSGITFKGEYSTDGGSTWTTIETVQIPETQVAQDIGVFVRGSYSTDTKGMSEFSGFTVS